MAVSLETLEGLSRKITVTVPGVQLEQEIDSRLKELTHKVKIDGFRPGKVPFTVVKKRYANSVRFDVMKDKIQSSLYEALAEQNLVPADTPEIAPENFEEGQDLKYSAIFEVFPTFEIIELDGEEVELISSEVSEKDIDVMLEKLREQSKTWKEVDRVAKVDDKVVIDFEGFIDNEPFEGGKAEDFELVLGSKQMIPGFEDGIVGSKSESDIEVNVKFPEDYNHEKLAGKDSLFKIKVKKVMEGELPNLDDDFAAKFNIKEGGVEALRKDIKENMQRELDRVISSKNREKIFDQILSKNEFEVPKSLVEKEIEHLKHEMYHKIFGHEHSDHETIPDFPRELFESNAIKRVKLGILFGDYVKKHEITVDTARVDAMIDKLAGAYDNPSEVRAWYKSNRNRMQEVEGLVIEEMVADKIIGSASIVQKFLDYQEAVNPSREQEEQEESEDKGA